MYSIIRFFNYTFIVISVYTIQFRIGLAFGTLPSGRLEASLRSNHLGNKLLFLPLQIVLSSVCLQSKP
jgi:hypothetical protein